MNQKWVRGSQSVELTLPLPSDSEQTSFCAQASETTQCPEIPPPPTLATILSTQRRNNYTQAIRKRLLGSAEFDLGSSRALVWHFLFHILLLAWHLTMGYMLAILSKAGPVWAYDSASPTAVVCSRSLVEKNGSVVLSAIPAGFRAPLSRPCTWKLDTASSSGSDPCCNCGAPETEVQTSLASRMSPCRKEARKTNV